MRLIHLRQAKPGMMLGRQVFDEAGNLLVGSGAELSDSLIERLERLGVAFIYVEDELGEGIDLEHDVISHDLRMEFYHQIKKVYRVMGEAIKAGEPPEKVASLVDRGRLADLVDDILDSMTRQKNAFIDIIYPKDERDYLCMHATHVAILSIFLAYKMGMPVKDIFSIGMGAIFADVGMLFVPEDIRFKPSSLTPQEWQVVRKHPEKGFSVVRKIELIDARTASVAYQHHERLDGSGYPRALKGDEIHRYARVVAVADVFDALVSPRPWRAPLFADEAIRQLEQGVLDGKFDASVVRILTRWVSPYPRGTAVILSDGTIGLVVRNNPSDWTRPVVKVIWDDRGNRMQPQTVDLSRSNTRVVKSVESPE